ncbi:MAG: hypothetical protein IKR56_03610 [Lachnospiraceae bacterium]|nr:hypothetical protein [Lachnospiraceae bacterium]
MYYKNRLIPLYADDYPYSFIWDGDNNGNLSLGNQTYKRVRKPEDLLRSQISHYKTWGGRSIAHTLVQFFLTLDDKKYFDRANTLVILNQLLLCASLGSGKKTPLRSVSPEKALLLTAGFFFCAPQIFASAFWITGSMNYLWMGLLQTAFVLPYSIKFNDTLFKMPGSLSFLSGLLAGFSSETGAGAAMMLTAMETLYSLKRKEYASWMGWGLAGVFLGILILCLCPGNRIRLRLAIEEEENEPEEMKEAPEDCPPGTIPNEYLYTPTMFKKWFKDGFISTVKREMWLHIPVILYFLQKKNRNPKTDLFLLAMESAAFAIPSVMMLSPEYPERATYSSVLYLLAASTRALDHLDIPKFSDLPPVKRLIAGALVSGMSIKALSSLIIEADLRVQIDRQIKYLKDNRTESHIYLEDVSAPSPYIELAGECTLSPYDYEGVCIDADDDSLNKAVAAYYGINKIKCGPYDGHVYEQNDSSSRLFALVNPLKSLILKTKEIITGKPGYDVLDTVYYPVKKCGRDKLTYHVYEKPLKKKPHPVIFSYREGRHSKNRIQKLKAITHKNGHDHIDLLKIVIRHSVFDTIRSIKNSGISIGQVCLEVREKDFYIKRKKVMQLVCLMHKMGYIVIFWDKRRSEFTFLKNDLRAK